MVELVLGCPFFLYIVVSLYFCLFKLQQWAKLPVVEANFFTYYHQNIYTSDVKIRFSLYLQVSHILEKRVVINLIKFLKNYFGKRISE